MNIDKVSFNIISNAFLSIAREMSADLIRSAYSTVIREAADASTCLIDRNGRILAQGPRRDQQVVLAEVRRDGRSSLYLKYGDWPTGICLALCVVFAAIGIREQFVRRRSGKRASTDHQKAP